jgi:hypothetical protein
LRQDASDKNKIQVGAVNFLIELQLKEGYGILDISSATTKNIIIEKPDDTIMIVPGSFITDGKDGLLYYRTQVGDLNQDGLYNVQANIEMPDFQGYSTPVSFEVFPNLPLTNN